MPAWSFRSLADFVAQAVADCQSIGNVTEAGRQSVQQEAAESGF
jgi:hypothetical protein